MLRSCSRSRTTVVADFDTLGGCPSSAKAQIREICHLIAIIVKNRKSSIVGMRDRIAD